MSDTQTEVAPQDDPDVEAVSPDESDPDTDPDAPDATDVDDDPDQSEGVNDSADPADEQPAPEPQVDDKEIEKAFKALGKVRDYVARRVGEIMGDDATQLIPCPACQDLAPGFVWPPSVAALSPEAEAGTRLLLGMQQPTDLEAHPSAVICETCQGKGQVQTPSKVPGYDVVDCPTCAATGRTLTSNVVPIVPVNGAPESPPIMTGPTVMAAPLSPEAEAAKAQGYMVIPPFDPSANSPAAV